MIDKIIIIILSKMSDTLIRLCIKKALKELLIIRKKKIITDATEELNDIIKELMIEGITDDARNEILSESGRNFLRRLRDDK